MTNPTRKQDAPEEYQDCARPCWQNLQHSYSYGNCAYAYLVDQEDATVATFGPIRRVNGRPQVEVADIPLMALLPWVRWLPVEERHDFLEEVAASKEPARTVLEWKHTAEGWADPDTLEALTRPMEMGDYGEVTPPSAIPQDPLKIYAEWQAGHHRQGWYNAVIRRGKDGCLRFTTYQGSKNTSAFMDRAQVETAISAFQQYLRELDAQQGGESSMSHDAAEAMAAQLILTEREERAKHRDRAADEAAAGDPAGPHPDAPGEGLGHDSLD